MTDDPAFLNWFAGFVDGEGCFVIGKRTRPGRATVYNLELRIKLREDDAEILFEIRDRLGIGTVYNTNAGGGPGHDSMTYAVYRKADLVALVKILDQYPLRAKKHRDYALFREAVAVWADAPIDWERIATVRERLIETRRFMPRVA